MSTSPSETFRDSHLQGNASSQAYLPLFFEPEDRLAKIQEFFPEIDTYYQGYAEKNHFQGFAYGIVLDGVLVHSGSCGFADLDKKIPVSPHSMFRIASMTKSFTAMAILMLRDACKLKLDDPVYFYIPEIKNQRLTHDSPVLTIRDLLMHTAGFPNDDPWSDRKLGETEGDFIALLKKGLFFSNPAGIAYEYSNLGYTMLGYIIQKVTGTSYQTFIAENIWKPLGMQAAWDFKRVPAAQLAQGYRWIDGKIEPVQMLEDGIFGAMGGIIASVESFSRYMALHLSAWPPRNDSESGPIKRSSIREMQQPMIFKELLTSFKYSDERECALSTAYGYGLNWVRDSHGRTFLGHSGGLPGFGSNWSILHEYGLGVILLANTTYAPATKVNWDVLDKLVCRTRLKPRQLPTSQIFKKRYDALVNILPSWENAVSTGIFAANFFLDNPIHVLKRDTINLFAKAGKVVSIGEVLPQNQLHGNFIVICEKMDLKVDFALTPENPPLIQHVQIKEVEIKEHKR